ncbi:hypothetical protein E7W75_05650 [Cronobacter sakazakii]|nr:hypothetical protein AGJ02_01110 [Cronobacter sakazakii]MCI0202453.1 hypothetical protein [Cronobacter sakazakii]MCI0294940.1 hypothetical protein [Cronobacter sakazakii]NCI09608.1 hypothetical protein [Cronobacter sakazakii]
MAGIETQYPPCFGALLVQEGHRLHYLADRAGISGAFSDSSYAISTRHFRC